MRHLFFLCAAVACLMLVAGCTESAPQQAVPAATATPEASAPAAGDTVATAAPTTVATTSSSVSGNTVSIYEMSYDPAVITVQAGALVRWVNRDSAIHSVVFSDASISPSGVLSASQSWSWKFNTPGTYAYHCGVHPKATGTVIVTA